MDFLFGLLILAAIAWWWLRRWPLTRCWFCRGRGKFTRGRRARECRWCGGRGYWLRWGVKVYGGKR